ncbi:hypothetical protein QYE76_003186 [Lolium multiflorum]|uniref:Uncharacterized protein n=1 Tax=Lolium multiflorum TaxID=4521 RepID=A0AAD8RS36_LOLMU|nr:hypothetical protein QYE76_003186 [Lolium multiflorum]
MPPPGAPRAKPSGAAPTAPPPKTSKLIKGKADGLQRPFRRPAASVERRGHDSGDPRPGKDRLPAPDPVGDRSSEEHFMRLRSAVKELDSAWYDATNNLMLTADARKALFEELLWEHRELAEAHDKCQVIPEASIDALKEQLAAAQREKDQLIRQHQEELSAHKTSYRELRVPAHSGWDLTMPRPSKPLKLMQRPRWTRLWRTQECHRGVAAELEELAKARKCRGKAARLEEEHKECNQLILQTDTLAYRLFPDSQKYAVKKVDARRKDQGQANLTVPWTPNDHASACAWCLISRHRSVIDILMLLTLRDHVAGEEVHTFSS